MDKINILVVDDEKMVREMLVERLQREPFVDCAYEAWDETSLLKAMGNHAVDMVLLDMKIPGTSGLALLKKLRSLGKQVSVIAFTALPGDEVIINFVKAGVDGIMHKDEGFGEMLKAINTVREFGTYFSPVVRDIVKRNQHRWDSVPPVLLTPQEMDFLKAISQGLTLIQVADILKMTEGSVNKFKVRLTAKLGVKNSADLMVFALYNGIF